MDTDTQNNADCSTVLSLVRPALLARKAYLPATPERQLVRLHANENPWSIEEHIDSTARLSVAVGKVAARAATGGKTATLASNTEQHDAENLTMRELNRYPQPKPLDLVEAMAAYYKVQPDQVLPVRGSDDGIDLLIRTFCEAGRDAIVVSSPAFSMYASFAEIQGVSVTDVPLKQTQSTFLLDIDAIVLSVEQHPEQKLVFLCTPNNPTGHSLSERDVLTVCQRLAGRAVVVVDEAYIEFSNRASTGRHIGDVPNLVILRTMSKAFGAAGLRMGAVLAHDEVVTVLQSITSPYALATPVVELALDGFTPAGLSQLQSRCQFLVEHRAQLAEALTDHPLVTTVFDSDANFLLVRFHDAKTVCSALHDAGVLVRDFSSAKGADNCLRISIGKEDENRQVLAVLDRLQSKMPGVS